MKSEIMKKLKLSLLADDTVCFCQNVESVQEILSIYEKYIKYTGLKLNKEKTIAKYMNIRMEDTKLFNIQWTKKSITTLGITVIENEDEYYEINYRPRINKMKALLNIWSSRNLSLKGKVIVINNLALTPLLYVSGIIHTPVKYIKEVKTLVLNFLWNNKKPKIKYNVLVQNTNQGGLKLTDFECKVSSLKINWVKRLCFWEGQWRLGASIAYQLNENEDQIDFVELFTGIIKKTKYR